MMAETGNLDISRQELVEFCQRWKIREMALFGTVLRDDFGPESDVDMLVTFEHGVGWTLLDFVMMRDELQDLLGRKVDLLTRSAVERSRNPIRRRRILDSARVIYVA